jgi:hypothetical protein
VSNNEAYAIAASLKSYNNTAAIGSLSTVAGVYNLNGAVTYSPTTFVNLGTPAAGTVTYCSNCTIANPCASGGTGAIAKYLNSTWVCN